MAPWLAHHAQGLRRGTVALMTNGRVDGIKRKIKAMLRQCHGMRDDNSLRPKPYVLHDSKRRLVG